MKTRSEQSLEPFYTGSRMRYQYYIHHRKTLFNFQRSVIVPSTGLFAFAVPAQSIFSEFHLFILVLIHYRESHIYIRVNQLLASHFRYYPSYGFTSSFSSRRYTVSLVSSLVDLSRQQKGTKSLSVRRQPLENLYRTLQTPASMLRTLSDSCYGTSIHCPMMKC
jgi:hypothetical protein